MANVIHCSKPGCCGIVHLTDSEHKKRGDLYFCDAECENGYDLFLQRDEEPSPTESSLQINTDQTSLAAQDFMERFFPPDTEPAKK